MAFLELRGVSKGYGAADSGAPDASDRRTEVLHDINLQVRRGEFLAIVGYSGAGKTTLISLIAGLLFPDKGEIVLDGKPVTGPGPERGVVFQNYSLLPWLTAYENIALAVGQAFPKEDQAARDARIRRYLELVGLGAAAGKRPSQLSGGMRQRVAVARALAMDPEVLLLDEPLGALDALTRGGLQGEIARIWQADRKTVLLITNDVDEAILLADRIIPLSHGPAATLGPAVTVGLARPRDRRELARDPEFKALRAELVAWLLASATGRAAPRSAAPAPAFASPAEVRP
jgi:nitrate/nitrite transport system ATP-binding protein